MTRYAAHQPHAETVRSHWWWRPGWRIGRRYYTWHLTFEDQYELHRLVTEYQAQLANVPGIDLVPLAWLHLTIQGIGFTDEVTEACANQVATEATNSLAEVPAPVRVTFSRAIVRQEAIALKPSPPEPIQAIRTSIREAIAKVCGENNVPDSLNSFDPHVSLGYFNTDGSSTPFTDSLKKTTPEPAIVEPHKASLIVLDRDAGMYRWQTHARVNLGKPEQA